MPTVHDVPAELLISKVTDHLRKFPQIQPPSWAQFVKTGSHAERLPASQGWWYTRCASLLRKIYLHGPLGLDDLTSMYGGRTRVHYSLAHHRDAGGSAIRKALQQLESAGFVSKQAGKGRILTSKGKSLLDRLSAEIFKELIKTDTALARYS
jgi:small subunit ribosomal protein S19e